MRTRRGGVLVVVLATVLVLAMVLAVVADDLVALLRGQELDGARQQAVLAAESVAALVEAQLVTNSASLQSLRQDIGPGSAARWWNLAGYCDGVDQDGDGWDDENGGFLLGRCLVRWRLEPVKVYSSTLADTGAAPVGQTYVVNSEPSAALETRRDDDAQAADPANTLYAQDTPYYHFRLVTDAYALTDESLGTGARPWRDPRQRLCHAQAKRIVQLEVTNLLRYALFHASEGPVGDIDLYAGTTLRIDGAVHSNASIYLSSGQDAGLRATPFDYHSIAGDAAAAGAIQIGSSTKRWPVTAVGGIFRQAKVANYLAAADGVPGADTDPWQIPLDGQNGMVGTRNLNGDTTASTRHTINGTKFTSLNDSRCAFTTNGMKRTFNGYVRDRQLGAVVVKTLANIPEMGGRPFEPQRLAGDTPLFTVGSDPNDGDPTQFTVHQTPTATRAYYTQDPATFAGPALLTTARTDWPVSAEGMTMRWADAERTVADVGVAATSDAASVGDGDAGFETNEAKGYYLARALYGADSEALVVDGVSGLTIRERRAQAPRIDSRGISVSAPPALPASGPLGADVAEDYALYLAGQYAVYLGGRNITDAFFAAIRAPGVTAAGMIASEDEFVDARESAHMAYTYGIDPRHWPTALDGAYRINALTLNLRAVQDFLLRTRWDDPGIGGPAGTVARQHCNGLVYLHRTRRSATYHPLSRPALVWAPGGGLGARYTAPDPAAGFPWAVREGAGPVETTRCAVRLRGGAAIDWEHDTNGDGVIDATDARLPLGRSGLTVVTPDRLYLWGDLDTVAHRDAAGINQTTPVAVFADGVTALSNAWRDGANQDFDADGDHVACSAVAATSTTYNTSLVLNNQPTEGWNADTGGSGGSSNLVRFLEDWGGATYTVKGSVVVMNRQRYSRGLLCYTPKPACADIRAYAPPTRQISFNADLLTQAGQPPFAPFGVEVTRAVSTVNILDN